MAKMQKADPSKPVDVGFSFPKDGTYVWQILDKIELWRAEQSDNYDGKSHSASINIEAVIDSVAKDIPNNQADESEVGQKQILKVFVLGKDGKETKMAAVNMGAILTFTGLFDDFIKNLGEDIDFTSNDFMLGLSRKLPGKFLCITHEITENKKGGKNFNIKTFHPLTGGQGAGSGSGGAAAGAKVDKKTATPDW